MDDTPSAADLPTVFPVFPLSGAVLFPRTTMPLNIFEPRYLAMVSDAHKTNGVIGMIQPDESRSTPGEPPALYGAGCLGRVTQMEETDDGRYLISLEGVCRFQLREELACTTPYRQVEGDFAPFVEDLNDPACDAVSAEMRERLLAQLKAYLEAKDLQADWEALAEVSGETLVSALAMLCPFDTADKQALLEEPDLAQRAQAVMMLLKFDTLGADSAPAAPH